MKMDLVEIQKRIDQGYVRKSAERDGLSVYCYTDKCMWDKAWDDVTKNLRGTVLDQEGSVIAFPFPKFFNVAEREETQWCNLPQNDNPTISEKVDGSLLLIFYHDNKVKISTKGSLDNIYIDYAYQILANDIRALEDMLMYRDTTLVCEVVLPVEMDTMRRVVDHPPGITLLAMYDPRTLKEIHDPIYVKELEERTCIKPVKVFTDLTPDDCHTGPASKSKGTEGWVIRFSNGLRVKIKTVWYICLFHWINKLDEMNIKELLIADEFHEKGEADLEWIYYHVPAELQKEVEEIAVNVIKRYNEETLRLNKVFDLIVEASKGSRKEFAALAKEDSRPWALFSMLDGKQYKEKLLEVI